MYSCILFLKNFIPMKKKTLLSILLSISAWTMAQNPPIGIENLLWWDTDYPTITWGSGIRTGDIKTVQYILSLIGEQPSYSYQ